MSEVVFFLRSLLFYTGYAAFTVVWGTLSLLIAWALPFHLRFSFIIQVWTRVILFWLRITCGIRFQIEGLENIPGQAAIVLAKHESTWETLALQQLFSPQATIVKRELLRIPFFGWAFALLKPIAINRNERRRALRELVEKGQRRLADNIWVLLFPEGTRSDPGVVLPFQAGAGLLAKASDRPVIIVAHDAGRCWPARQFIKRPGCITLIIDKPLPVEGLDTKGILRAAEERMRALAAQLYPDLPEGNHAAG
ncbi:MAG: lysophospholipid acyltransferase family protein [Pseudomonadota bacterium]